MTDSNSSNGQTGKEIPQFAEVRWLEAEDSLWGVRVLDVRPITGTMISTSQDPQCAANAMAFRGNDGTSFIGAQPVESDSFSADLVYPIDRMLADGVLFSPSVMEEKWAIFQHQGHIIFVRSWTHNVHLIADVQTEGDHIRITKITGALTGQDDEDPEFIIRAVDYMLRSHALQMPYPAPMPAGLKDDTQRAALWCFSTFGNRAQFAATERPSVEIPLPPLRTDSLLHIAAARGDSARIETLLNLGIPVDLLSRNGNAPLHWSVAQQNPAIAELLLQRGSPVDVCSIQRTTPLMTAVETGSEEKPRFLLDHGADPNAADIDGFTALHRAAEMGHLHLVKLLLARGAGAAPVAEGHTPQSLAEQHGHREIVELLKNRR
ncbi:MAG: ankyrin repeat domain-containing protein [Acidobacteriia bacterium]|nr:ankyrin repeat domain-containing protein [Terriglobia bacterium]